MSTTLPVLPRLFRHRPQASELPALFAQLQAAGSELKQAADELEAQFLATSSELEVLAGHGDQFVKQVQKLVGLATGKECDGSVFAEAIQLIQEATRFLAECLTKTDEMLERLQNYNAQIEELLGAEAELQRTMLPLTFVQILFRVESARLDPGTQQMFGSLTQEIEALHSRVREIFGTKFKQLEQAHRTIGQVIAQLARQSQALQLVMATQRAQIETSLATLKDEMISNAERDSRLGQLSRDLSGEVNQIVMGLQVQDIISQKLAHVHTALEPIEKKFAEFNGAASRAASKEPLQFLQQSCRLEAGQVQAAQAELAKAEASIQGGIQKVLTQLTEIDSHSLSLEEFKLLTTSFDGMVQVLLEMIEKVRELIATTVASAAEAYEMLRPLGSMASGLTEVVNDISGRIQLIGLNAQIQASRAAQENLGTALEVLSARTSEISTETNRISNEAAAQLDAVAAGLAESVKAFEKLRTDGLAEQTRLNQEGCVEEKQLHAFRDSALETLQAIGSTLENIQKQARQSLATVNFKHFHQVTLPALCTPLAAIADEAEKLLQSQGCEVAQASLIGGFQRDYTMASEREVFADMTTGQGAPQQRSVSAKEVASPEIELFVALPGEANVELSLPQESENKDAEPPKGGAVASNNGLGDNAELF